MTHNYTVKSVEFDEKKNQSLVTVEVYVDENKKTAKAMVGTFPGPVPRETIENWLKSTVEPKDTVEITFAKGVRFPESVETPLKTKKTK